MRILVVAAPGVGHLLPLLPLRPLRPLFPLQPLIPLQPTLPLFPLTPLRPLFPLQPLIPIQPFLPLPGPIEPPVQPGSPLSAENVRQLEELIIRSRK
jgi:hypothetical protein